MEKEETPKISATDAYILASNALSKLKPEIETLTGIQEALEDARASLGSLVGIERDGDSVRAEFARLTTESEQLRASVAESRAFAAKERDRIEEAKAQANKEIEAIRSDALAKSVVIERNLANAHNELVKDFAERKAEVMAEHAAIIAQVEEAKATHLTFMKESSSERARVEKQLADVKAELAAVLARHQAGG
jgi:hypothetical protein